MSQLSLVCSKNISVPILRSDFVFYTKIGFSLIRLKRCWPGGRDYSGEYHDPGIPANRADSLSCLTAK